VVSSNDLELWEDLSVEEEAVDPSSPGESLVLLEKALSILESLQRTFKQEDAQ
jgi:hypothetical protein